MSEQRPKATSTVIPSGFIAVPICAQAPGTALAVCVLVRERPDPLAGRLVLLQDLMDAKVHLGAVVDLDGAVQQWMEIWVQDTSGLIGSALAQQEALSNSRLDDRWRQYVEAFERIDGGGLIHVGAEKTHPAPVVLDLNKKQPFVPADSATGAHWTLCTDDALLAKRSMAPFSTSLHRYLYMKDAGEKSALVPVTPGAPTNADTKPLADLIGNDPNVVPFNLGGGLMLVRKYRPLSWEAFVDFLSRGAWDDKLAGRSSLDPDGTIARLRDCGSRADLNGSLLVLQGGAAGRLLEVLHLKLRLLADAVKTAHDLVLDHQRPFLELSADSFAVALDSPACGLPFLWTAHVSLSDPGAAVEIAIPGSDAAYFLPSRQTSAAIYRPPVSSYALGTGSVRIPRVLTDPSGATIVELTLTTQTPIDPARNDLIRLHLSVGGSPLNLVARCEREEAMAPGEWKLRTIQQKYDPAVMEKIRTSEGADIRGVRFELVPLLSTPCDLYSLAVLAARTLLVNGAVTHAIATDRIASLARHAASLLKNSEPLTDRIEALFAQDARWGESLGPQQLIRGSLKIEEALELVPPKLWFSVLAMIVRMLPGIGPDSIARDYGDAAPGALHRVFEPAMADLQSLLVRTRSLIVVDWRLNREIQAVITKAAAASSAPTARPAAAQRA